MADGVEVSVKLGLVMVELRLSFWVQVVLATYVGESACLSERDVDVVDAKIDRGHCRLLSVGPVVRKLVGAEFGVGKVQFKNLCKGGDKISLLL